MRQIVAVQERYQTAVYSRSPLASHLGGRLRIGQVESLSPSHLARSSPTAPGARRAAPSEFHAGTMPAATNGSSRTLRLQHVHPQHWMLRLNHVFGGELRATKVLVTERAVESLPAPPYRSLTQHL